MPREPDAAMTRLENQVAHFAKTTAASIAAGLVRRCLSIVAEHPDPSNQVQLQIDLMAAPSTSSVAAANRLIDEARALAGAAAESAPPAAPPFDLLLHHFDTSAN